MRPRRTSAALALTNAPADLACACATARQVARVLTQLYDSHLRDTGLEAPQFALLMTLHGQGPCSQAALGRRYALDKTTVSRNLGWLQRKGWVVPSVGDDRRERLYALTVAGRRRLGAAIPEWKKAQEDLRRRLSAREWDAMFEVFKTITAAATSMPSEAGCAPAAAGRRVGVRHACAPG